MCSPFVIPGCAEGAGPESITTIMSMDSGLALRAPRNDGCCRAIGEHQAVEHYEISRYGSLKTWATELGYKDAVTLLDATLNEEKNTDNTLSQLAKSEVNHHAETAKAA